MCSGINFNEGLVYRMLRIMVLIGIGVLFVQMYSKFTANLQ